MERRIPARFGRLAMAFDEVATKFIRPCESSGSDHSPDRSFTDLSDLVNSFLEREDGEINNECNNEVDHQEVLNRSDSDELWSDPETKDELASLFGCDDSDENRTKVRNEVDNVMGFDGVSVEKRKLMTRLRERGLDAGICKSKWEKQGRIPAGDFEYMDVNMSNTRYIVELNLVSHFEIARPTKGYTALLKIFPRVFVGKIEHLKRIVRIMCSAIKVSLKSVDMPVAPWRRNGYMQVKWFGSYKRTTNAVSMKVRAEESESSKKISVGFELGGSGSRFNYNVYGCRSVSPQFGGIKQSRAKSGYLAAVFAGDELKS